MMSVMTCESSLLSHLSPSLSLFPYFCLSISLSLSLFSRTCLLLCLSFLIFACPYLFLYFCLSISLSLSLFSRTCLLLCLSFLIFACPYLFLCRRFPGYASSFIHFLYYQQSSTITGLLIVL